MHLTLREKISKNFATTRLLMLSFLVVILIGTLLLSMPFANNVKSLGFVDNLFVATSATCVTGLLPVSVIEQFNLFGQIVLILLMQIGGLGLMTFLCIILTLSKRKLFVSEKKAIQDSLNTFDLNDISTFIKKILKYTLVFESIGFVLICIRFIPEFGVAKGMFKALFLTVSSFCNAGIDNLGSDSLLRFAGDPIINFTVMGLIIMGGLGFTVWLDLNKHLKDIFGEKGCFSRFKRQLSLHTKVVLTITFSLLVSGTIIFFILEFNNPDTIGNMGFFEKIMTSMFQSTTLRTAGFSTITIGNCRAATQFIMCLFMFIGGSPGGTAGGIKTTTFAVLLFCIVSIIKGNPEHNHVYKREITYDTFIKAFSVTTLYIFLLLVGVILLSVSENLSFLSLVYEAVSAIATVGLTMGITPLLSMFGKIVIILLMFVGRVGPVTITLSFFTHRSKKRNAIAYPHDDLLVG